MAQIYLASILPGYLASHPKVDLVVEAIDREVNLIEERFDLTLRAGVRIADVPGFVAKKLGSAVRILMASPAYLDRKGRPEMPHSVSEFETLSRPTEVFDGRARWELAGPGSATIVVQHTPRIVCDDRRMLLEAAIQGIGITLLPEQIVAPSISTGLLTQVLAEWTATKHLIYLLYITPCLSYTICTSCRIPNDS